MITQMSLNLLNVQCFKHHFFYNSDELKGCIFHKNVPMLDRSKKMILFTSNYNNSN